MYLIFVRYIFDISRFSLIFSLFAGAISGLYQQFAEPVKLGGETANPFEGKRKLNPEEVARVSANLLIWRSPETPQFPPQLTLTW